MASIMARAVETAVQEPKSDFWEDIGPSTIATFVFAGLFGAGAILHLYQLWRYRAWHFIAFVIGAFMMAIGYIFRYISIQSPHDLGPYVVQTLLIILPPSLYAATIYMIYGRVVRLVDAAHLSLIRPTWVTKIFVASDAIAFIVQASGGAMLTMDGKEAMGKNILLTGLYVQLASFGFFLAISTTFYYRVRTSGMPRRPNYGRYHWTTMLKVLYFAAGLIISRCIFRIIEFSADEGDAIQTNEVFAYCLDAVPMLVVQTVFHICHGGMVLPTRGVYQKGELLSADGSQYELSREQV